MLCTYTYVCITYPCMYGTRHTYPLRLQYLTSSFFSSLEAPVYVRASEDWCIIHQAIQHINHSYIRYIYQYIGQDHHWSFEYLHRVGTYLLVIPLPTLCMMGKIEKKTGLYLRGLWEKRASYWEAAEAAGATLKFRCRHRLDGDSSCLPLTHCEILWSVLVFTSALTMWKVMIVQY